MCGIAGYFGKGNREILQKMTRELIHRGPDDEGLFVDEKAGLGHRRLSIIDLSVAGHQPMSNEDGSVWLVFNGEIYNFKELKKELTGKHDFQSDTDTEVIIHLYEEMGAGVFNRLNGMFSIAIYDKKEGKVVLARDRMGKKPLYWGIFDETLIFGSELKSLIQHSSFVKELDLASLNKYFQYEYVPTPHSIFKNVFKLEPGHYIEYNGKDLVKNKYWDIKFNLENPSENDAIKNIDGIIEGAVKERMISDVPLGIFLSGGIDSSIIAYYAQKNSTSKIKTFSIGFKESSFDESFYARRVAKYLGTEHSEEILDSRDSLELIPQIAELLDEPMADSSIIPTYLLSKFTAKNVTVALGGDGGDELFCGYDTFVAHRIADFYEKVPSLIREKVFSKIVNSLPTSFNNISLDFKLKKFFSGFLEDKMYRNQVWLGSFDRNERAELFTNEKWEEIKNCNEFEDIDNYLNTFDGDDENNQLIYLYLRMYMMDQVLVKVDRASMYNSLEVRTPLLDYRLVDYVNSLPYHMKIRGLTTKYILKKTMEGKLPNEIIYRKKKGFGVPVAEWLLKELKPMVLELLCEEKIRKQGLFNYQYINKILQEHFSRKKDNRKRIWALIVFQFWYEKWFEKI